MDANSVADFFIATVTHSPASFALKLTLLYVINDIIHHGLVQSEKKKEDTRKKN